MRLNEILQNDDVARTFNSAVKYSNGYFKSEKQSKFILDNIKSSLITDKDLLSDKYGVELNDNEKAYFVNASFQFGHGPKGFQTVTWVFVIDNLGVIRKYKTKKSEGVIKPELTKVEFTRDSSLPIPDWASAENLKKSAIENKKKILDELVRINSMSHLGKAGEVITNIDLVGVKVIDHGVDRYGNWSITSVFKTEDGSVVYWGNLPKDTTTEEFVGKKFKMLKATIKDVGHNKKGEPFTKILRPKFQ